jgi:hypothetical protein
MMKLIDCNQDLQLNEYPQGFIDSVINARDGSHPKKEDKPLGFVYIPYMKGVSEKFRRVGNRYNIRMIFKTKRTLRNSFMKTRPRGICYRQLSVSVAFPVNVAEATLIKPVDL